VKVDFSLSTTGSRPEPNVRLRTLLYAEIGDPMLFIAADPMSRIASWQPALDRWAAITTRSRPSLGSEVAGRAMR